jgi:H+-translocating NAD(P) transhydrogenase subunit alpha
MDFISILSIFVMACFIVGALIAGAAGGSPTAKWLGLIAIALASVNIFGGFAVTARMLAMYKKKER